jgi:Flp pilus assembly protein TadD
VRLAAIAMQGGQAERAITLLEPGLAAAPDDLELVPLLARAYLEEDRVDSAQQVIDAALARRASAPELLAARGALELRRGRLPEALAALRSAVAGRPEDASLQADLGEAARRAGEADAARAAFDAALAQRADHTGALIGHARLALAAGELAQAEQRLDAAARTGREALEVARLRGELLVVRGDGALGATVMAPLARTHDDARLWAALGHLQAQAESDRDASRSYDRALRRARNDPEVRLGESLIAVRRGDLGGARRAIEAAEERAGTPSPELRARLAVARGRLEFENGDFDDVVRLANEAITLDARNASAHLLLANVAIERGDSPVEHLRRAVAGNAPPPEALGRLASRLGRGEEACRLATRYLQVAPRGYDAGEVRDVARDCR